MTFSSETHDIELWNLIKGKKSWFTQTDYFQKVVQSSFEKIDMDKSGTVTPEELYAGLLLIHLNLSVYAGAAASRPASKKYVVKIFKVLDVNHSGKLTKEEFGEVMKVLYSQVFMRIVLQWSFTLMLVPLISTCVIKYTVMLYSMLHESTKNSHDNLDPMQRLLCKLWAAFLYATPQSIDKINGLAWNAVPKEILKHMPFTILTFAQTSIALPYLLDIVEDFFMQEAEIKVVKYERGLKLKEG